MGVTDISTIFRASPDPSLPSNSSKYERPVSAGYFVTTVEWMRSNPCLSLFPPSPTQSCPVTISMPSRDQISTVGLSWELTMKPGRAEYKQVILILTSLYHDEQISNISFLSRLLLMGYSILKGARES